MQIGDYQVMTDTVTKFFNTVRVSGWFFHPKDVLAAVGVSGEGILRSVSKVGLPHGGVVSMGSNLGFTVQCLRDEEELLGEDLTLNLTSRAGWSASLRLLELA